MNQVLEIQELAIVITAKNYDPSLLNPELLKYSGVIPEDWKLVRKPIVSSRGSQLVFQNRVLIASKPNNLMFVEAWNHEENTASKIPDLINRYINVLRTIEYQAIGINFRGYINAPNNSNHYLFDNLIKPGEWQNCEATSIKPEVNLMFDYQEKQLNLNIRESNLNLPDSEQVPIVVFNGNCNHNLAKKILNEDSTNDASSRLSKLEEIVDNWQQDLELYQNTVAKFIGSQKSQSKDSVVEAVAV